METTHFYQMRHVTTARPLICPAKSGMIGQQVLIYRASNVDIFMCGCANVNVYILILFEITRMSNARIIIYVCIVYLLL